MDGLDRQSNFITIAEFYENHELGKYNYDPPYQRKSIWSEEKQSFLIDSIIRNFPIPPIFLHQRIDATTGKTQFDVVDGKQRLSSIINFISGEIPIASEIDLDEAVEGKFFNEITSNDFKKEFWRYRIPLELIDPRDENVIDEIFDRLNRNGERLNGQELRKAKYHNKCFLNFVSNIANENIFWNTRLARATDISRMEDEEFISELIFALHENTLFSSSQKIIDQKYEEYTAFNEVWVAQATINFSRTTQVLEGFDLDYEALKITGVSHLFGLWTLADYMVKNNITIDISARLNSFYQTLRTNPSSDENVFNYKKSMSSGTKEVTQRQRRKQALIAYTVQ